MLWVKAFHIIAMVCWFAALFYLPRLFVYHAMSEDQISRERFQVMERKLYRGIATPSMIVTVLLGLWLASFNWDYYRQAGWFWIKIGLVGLLMGYHHMCGRYMRMLREEQSQHSHVFFRWFNEAPVLILVAVILLVELQPQL
jgi:protoporphyrinogen IX oxidase